MTQRPDADEHSTDAADLDLHGDGANEPVHGGDPQLSPGEAGDDDAAPTQVGGGDDGSQAEREHLLAEVRDGRDADDPADDGPPEHDDPAG